jgi:uncharacterized protein (DUF1501 family)
VKGLLSRRQAITGSAIVAIGTASKGGFGAVPSGRPDPVVVFVCLRGGADGLSLVVPYGNRDYYAARPHTAIRAPGSGDGSAIDLDGYFGLHPRFVTTARAFARHELAVLLGVGWPELVRSHTDARHKLDATIIQALDGRAPHRAAGSLEEQFTEVAARVRDDSGPRGFVVESLGWDTHACQGSGAEGWLADRVGRLDAALAGFRMSLGALVRGVLVAVVSEFGRSVSETPMGGTDDGGASVVLLLRGEPTWQRVLGHRPRLACDQLTHGRYVPTADDLRKVLFSVAHGAWPT